MTKFIVYWKTLPGDKPCKYCEKAKSFLSRLGYEYDARDLADPVHMAFFKSQGFLTVPQIYAIRGGTTDYVGGYDDLVDWLED